MFSEIVRPKLGLIDPRPFSYVCYLYAEIFEKMSSGGLEVSFSIYKSEVYTGLLA